MKDLVLPFSPLFDPKNKEVEAPSNPKFHIAKQMETFLQGMTQVMLILHHLMLHLFIVLLLTSKSPSLTPTEQFA